MQALFSFDFSIIFSFQSIFFICLGVVLGLLVGALPGLSASVGVAVLLPLTFTMEPLHAVLMLAALYAAAEYSGSITAIILGIPGTASAVPIALDGHPIAKAGHPGRALGYSLTAAALGGIFGALVLLLLTVPLARIALRFSDPEIFLLALLGLVSVVGLGSKDIPKSIISVLLGLLLATVGMDVFTGMPRFTMGTFTLMEGLSLVALITGLFAFSEIFNMSQGDLGKRHVTDAKNLRVHITWAEFKGVFKNIVRGSVIGTIIGIIPGLGPTVGSWIAYTEAKRTSKNPEKFGTGEPNGIVAPESASNAVVGGALLPLLTLGIPGSATVAVILVALLIHGVQPGPRVFIEQPDLIYGIIWGYLLANIAMYVIARFTTAQSARLLTIPTYALLPVVFMAALIGSYGARSGNMFDVAMALAIGCVGYFVRKLDYSFPAFILAFVLGSLLESSLRRSLMISQGSFDIFFTRTYSQIVIGLIVLVIASSVYSQWKKSRAAKAGGAE